jgi:hypothetical protein
MRVVSGDSVVVAYLGRNALKIFLKNCARGRGAVGSSRVTGSSNVVVVIVAVSGCERTVEQLTMIAVKINVKCIVLTYELMMVTRVDFFTAGDGFFEKWRMCVCVCMCARVVSPDSLFVKYSVHARFIDASIFYR